MGGKELPDGIAIITGAVGGMGSQCVRHMAEAGWSSLLLCDLDEQRLEQVAAPLRSGGTHVEVLAGDLSDGAWSARLAEKLGSREIAALIHAAGVSPALVSDADRIFEINLDAALRMWRVARPRMAQGSGAVLFASIAGHLAVRPDADAAFDLPMPLAGSGTLRHLAADANEAYLLTKRAILALVRREAKSLYTERKARIVSVSPGMIDTVMTQGVENDLTRSLLASSAISRYGRPEEVAEACVFLCSPAASFITGCDLLVDGGELAGLRGGVETDGAQD